MLKLSKPIYYILNYTWGLLLTVAGWILAFALWITGHKAHRFGPCLVFQFGNVYWGGFSLGTTIVVDNDPENIPKDKDDISPLLNHEFGHSIQNALFGPFMLFLVSIPSMIRYWYMMSRAADDPNYWAKVDYDAIWFEGTATRWGTDNYEAVWRP